MKKNHFDIVLDMMGMAGAACVVLGVALIYPPAAWIVGGAAALAMGIYGAKKWA